MSVTVFDVGISVSGCTGVFVHLSVYTCTGVSVSLCTHICLRGWAGTGSAVPREFPSVSESEQTERKGRSTLTSFEFVHCV